MGKRKKRSKRLHIVVSVLILTFLFAGFRYRFHIKYFANYAYCYVKDNYRLAKVKAAPKEVFYPLDYSMFGIDVSRYQKRINWEQLADARVNEKPISFVFVKATEGATWVDPYFKHNWKEAGKAGYYRGAYHYYKPEVNSIKQMENMKRILKVESGDLPPVLDVEEIGDMGRKRFLEGVINLLKQMEAHYGIRPIIYTNTDYYSRYFTGEEFAAYTVWIARFSLRKPTLGERSWAFWQFTEKGRLYGIPAQVDINVFAGDKLDFQKLLKQ